MARDFTSADPLRESLERSLARRNRSRSKAGRQAARKPASTRVPVKSALIVLVMATIASVTAGGHGTRPSAAARTPAHGPTRATAGRHTADSGAAVPAASSR
jgi:hypothetical protein